MWDSVYILSIDAVKAVAVPLQPIIVPAQRCSRLCSSCLEQWAAPRAVVVMVVVTDLPAEPTDHKIKKLPEGLFRKGKPTESLFAVFVVFAQFC